MEEMKDEILYGNQHSLSKYTMLQTVSGAGLIVAVYLVLVLKLLPAFMMNRKPFALKRLILVYNVSQVVFSAYMFYVYSDYILHHGLFPKNCPQINPKFFPIALYNVSLFFIAKHADLLDTVFFTLRKKDYQVSFLHLYHHSMMILWSWISYVYIPTDHFVVTGTLNSFVHVLMYTYYAISSLGPQYSKYIWWKKHLTKAQLVQFVLGLTCTYYQQKFSPCPMPDGIHNFVLFFLISFFVLFMEFYFRSYRNSKNFNGVEKRKRGIQNCIHSAYEIKNKA